jgi:hypothetical protein
MSNDGESIGQAIEQAVRNVELRRNLAALSDMLESGFLELIDENVFRIAEEWRREGVRWVPAAGGAEPGSLSAS